MTPKECPSCKQSLETVPNEPCKFVGIYDLDSDMTTHWQCLLCNHEWERVRHAGK